MSNEVGSSYVSSFFNGVRSSGSYLGQTLKADYGHTENLVEFIVSGLKFGGEVCERAITTCEGYLLVMKILELPKNFVALCWSSEPSVNYFTLNISALEEGIKPVLNLKYSLKVSSIIDELLKVTKNNEVKAYYQYRDAADFQEHLAAKLKGKSDLPAEELQKKINAIDFKLIKNDEKLHFFSNETLHKYAGKCFALSNVIIPVAWFASIGGFSATGQGLAYLAGSYGKNRVFGLVGKISIPALVTIMETVVVASFVTAFALKTWASVRVYFAEHAELAQRAAARNSALDTFLLGALCFINLTGGNSNRFAPVATGFHMVHDLTAPNMREVKAPKTVTV